MNPFVKVFQFDLSLDAFLLQVEIELFIKLFLNCIKCLMESRKFTKPENQCQIQTGTIYINFRVQDFFGVI